MEDLGLFGQPDSVHGTTNKVFEKRALPGSWHGQIFLRHLQIQAGASLPKDYFLVPWSCCLEYLVSITLPVTLATGVFGHPILAFISALFTAALVVRVLLRLDFQNYLLNFRFSKKATKTDEIYQYLANLKVTWGASEYHDYKKLVPGEKLVQDPFSDPVRNETTLRLIYICHIFANSLRPWIVFSLE